MSSYVQYIPWTPPYGWHEQMGYPRKFFVNCFFFIINFKTTKAGVFNINGIPSVAVDMLNHQQISIQPPPPSGKPPKKKDIKAKLRTGDSESDSDEDYGFGGMERHDTLHKIDLEDIRVLEEAGKSVSFKSNNFVINIFLQTDLIEMDDETLDIPEVPLIQEKIAEIAPIKFAPTLNEEKEAPLSPSTSSPLVKNKPKSNSIVGGLFGTKKSNEEIKEEVEDGKKKKKSDEDSKDDDEETKQQQKRGSRLGSAIGSVFSSLKLSINKKKEINEEERRSNDELSPSSPFATRDLSKVFFFFVSFFFNIFLSFIIGFD